MEILRKCPCCQSEAEFVDIPVSGSLLWQVTCSHCGLSTDLDDDRMLCLEQWNRREQEDRLRMMLLSLAIGGAFLALITFVIGILLGLNSAFS